MIDTHCHIDDPQYAEGLDAFLAEQRQDGVECILVPGVDKTSVKNVLEVCDRYPDYLFPALGLHPENVKEDWREQLATIKAAVDARMHQLSTVNCQLSTLNCQLSTVNCEWYLTMWSAIPLVNVVLTMMATRRILKDEALVRAADRLR